MTERDYGLGTNNIQGLEVDDARRHLDKAGREYYEAISSGTPESLVEVKDKLQALYRFVPNARTVVSVGVGNGEEIHALEELFGKEGAQIIGLDLSSMAVTIAKERINRNGLRAKLIQGSGIDMPFKNESINGFVLSAILHEIYSYV